MMSRNSWSTPGLRFQNIWMIFNLIIVVIALPIVLFKVTIKYSV